MMSLCTLVDFWTLPREMIAKKEKIKNLQQTEEKKFKTVYCFILHVPLAFPFTPTPCKLTLLHCSLKHFYYKLHE